MIERFLKLFYMVLVVGSLFGCKTSSPSPQEIKQRICLIPHCEKYRKLYDKMSERMLAKFQNLDFRKTAAKKSFKNWKKYEDEYVSFIYPDDPSVVFEIKRPKEQIPIMGGAVGTTENTFFRSYRLGIGKHTYFVFLLEKTDSFDDGICLCGAVVFQKYLFRDGTLFRYDLMKNGLVKKIQALSDDCRVVAFEWTHLPINQQVYLKIASSLKFKKTGNQDKLKTKIIQEYGGYGFLEKGMTKSEVIKLLGRPNRQEKSKLFYGELCGRYHDTITVEFDPKGIFQGFKKGWWKTVLTAPKYGSIEWMREKVNTGDDECDAKESKNYKLSPLSKDDIGYIFSTFVELTPKVSPSEWAELCHIIYDLANSGYMDKKILPSFKKRYLSEEAPHYANWLVEKYSPNDKEKLLIAQLRIVYAEALDKKKGKFVYLSETHNLLSFLGRKSVAAKELIIVGMKHPDPGVRDDAYYFSDYLPDKEAIPLLLKGLKDKNKNVREKCIKALNELDLKTLGEILASEKNKENKLFLREAIKKKRNAKKKVTDKKSSE